MGCFVLIRSEREVFECSEEILYWKQGMCKSREWAKQMVPTESWSEAGICDVTVVVQLVFGFGWILERGDRVALYNPCHLNAYHLSGEIGPSNICLLHSPR